MEIIGYLNKGMRLFVWGVLKGFDKFALKMYLQLWYICKGIEGGVVPN